MDEIQNDIAQELAMLQTLTGIDFSRKLEQICQHGEFHPVIGETEIFSAISEQDDDYDALISASRRAVTHGYRVYILPNPKGIRTADVIFVLKGIYRLYDLKTIQGKASAGNRMNDSIGQTNRVLLNISTDYNARLLASDIKTYFENNLNAVEVLIFKGKKVISVVRDHTLSPMYNRLFRRKYEK
jgi:hypothetical protein